MVGRPSIILLYTLKINITTKPVNIFTLCTDDVQITPGILVATTILQTMQKLLASRFNASDQIAAAYHNPVDHVQTYRSIT